ncbi:MAG: hypothetical protein AELANPGJ_03597 [Anaerolineae bacterium]|nr:hypothetical protein [Anaerolineae bacterium]
MAGNYVYNITVSPNTSYYNAKKVPIYLSSGIINKVMILFPAGCAGLTKAQILDKEHVLFPTNSDEYYSGNNTTISFDTFYEIDKSNTFFNIVIWNEDTVFSHTVFFMINIIPNEASVGIFSSMFARMF